jgi:acid phosphatase (class A)
MKRPSSLSLVVCLFIAAGATGAAGQSLRVQTATYLDVHQVDLSKLLAPPPAAEFARGQVDMATVLEVQRIRTPEQVERARADVKKSVFRFADVLGPAFNQANLPKTAALFDAANHDASMIAKTGKDFFSRARPYITNPDVHPSVTLNPKDGNDSYPSGHATFGYMTAILLAQMVPEKRDAIFVRGREYGENRVVDGVHYPSDVEAGRIDGTLVAEVLMANPEFQKAFAEARAEVRAALALN